MSDTNEAARINAEAMRKRRRDLARREGARAGAGGQWGGSSIADLERRLSATRAELAEARAAIGEAILQIEYLHEKFRETGSGNNVLARLHAALAPVTESASEGGN